MLEEKQILDLQRELEKLRAENADLKKRKKFGLVWEEQSREKDIDDKEHYPFLVTKGDGFGFDNGEARKNILIEGDNYHALEILQYTHKGAVDVIYIDPPYNTGKKKEFRYNDHWVDKEDGYRHSKWLTFMDKRLRLAKDLLKKEGLIFMSIDDNEHSRLKLLCDEIFGESSFVGNITWEKRTKAQNTKTAKDLFQSKTEYILVYKRGVEKARFNLIKKDEKKYDKKDDNGPYREKAIEQMSALGMRGRETMIYPILEILPREGFQWKVGLDTIEFFSQRDDVFLKDNRPYIRIRPEDEDVNSYFPFWSHFIPKEIGTAESAKTELSEVLGKKDHDFETVKPIALIQKLLEHSKMDKNNPVILDFFAGSGTTGHAVMDLAFKERAISADEETSRVTYNPQFILVTNNENNICEEVCYERLKRANEKYGYDSNLEYLKTELLEYDPERHCDLDIRAFMVEKITEIIKVREACFKIEPITNYLQKFVKDEKSVYVLHNVYDMKPQDYKDVIEILAADSNDNINIYVLAMSNHAHYAQKLSKCGKSITFEPLPESFLKLLRKIDTNIRKTK